MDFGSYLPLLLPLLAVPLVLLTARRLPPATATWLTAASAVVLTLGAVLSLTLFTIAGLTGLSTVVNRPVDATSATLLAAIGVAGSVATARRVRALRAARRLAEHDGELVVIRQDRPIAHAVPGRPGRIVVSTGMLAGLNPGERRALLAHERAHLRCAHHLFVAVVDVFAAANPLLHPLRGTVRYTTERWADELAARAVGSRSVVARAVGKAALATKDATDRDPVLLAVAAGEVPSRVAALLATPPARRLRQVLAAPTNLIALIAVALAVTSIGCAIEATGDLLAAGLR
jgi:Zn-dependent protease with chaperone function